MPEKRPYVYQTIVADPPWPSMHQRSTYHRGKPERHYSTMTVDDICALPVGDLATPDAHLWVWGVNRCMDEAYRVVRSWGFRPMSVLTWCKPGLGMGYYLRNNTEHCIFATRGKPMVPAERSLGSWFQWPRGRHSAKPPEFFGIVERISPGPYLELFARDERDGWDHWGNEVAGVELPGFDGHAANPSSCSTTPLGSPISAASPSGAVAAAASSRRPDCPASGTTRSTAASAASAGARSGDRATPSSSRTAA